MGISFDGVERVWLVEKTSPELAQLGEEFYPEVARYVASLGSELCSSKGLRAELLRAELRNVLRMVQEIHSLRVLKAMEEEVKGRRPTGLVESESRAFEGVRKTLEKLYEELVAPVIERKEIPSPREPELEMLITLGGIPEIIGEDLKGYGPFEAGEIISLPKRSAELLVKRGFARRIESKPRGIWG